LKSLKTINFTNNPITSIPSCITALKDIENLSLPISAKKMNEKIFYDLEKQFLSLPAEENVNFLIKK
jgi:hypothetical protein